MKKERKLHFALKPLYEKLLAKLENYDEDLVPFCVQWGSRYNWDGSGMMFCGRATNGWYTTSRDIDVLMPDDFDKLTQGERIFNRADQMTWLNDTENYNPNKSAFWRVVKAISSTFYGEDWKSHIVYNNLCKMAQGEKNPSDPLFYDELDPCSEIFNTELEILNPKHVILLTGLNWAEDFLSSYNGHAKPQPITQELWGNDTYEVALYQIRNRFFYVTEHPQCKEESSHVAALVKLIKGNL